MGLNRHPIAGAQPTPAPVPLEDPGSETSGRTGKSAPWRLQNHLPLRRSRARAQGRPCVLGVDCTMSPPVPSPGLFRPEETQQEGKWSLCLGSSKGPGSQAEPQAPGQSSHTSALGPADQLGHSDQKGPAGGGQGGGLEREGVRAGTEGSGHGLGRGREQVCSACSLGREQAAATRQELWKPELRMRKLRERVWDCRITPNPTRRQANSRVQGPRLIQLCALASSRVPSTQAVPAECWVDEGRPEWRGLQLLRGESCTHDKGLFWRLLSAAPCARHHGRGRKK